MTYRADMPFVHFSEHPVTVIRSGDQCGGMTDHGAKPDGLWFCLNGDRWPKFLAARTASGEEGRESSRYKTRIAIDRPERFAIIASSRDLANFSAEFSEISPETLARISGRFRRSPFIDWPRVAATFHGIVIDLEPAVYDAGWFRSWDIPSGCIWDGSFVRLIPLNYTRA